MQICVSIVSAPGAAELGESLGLDRVVREDACLPPQLREVPETKLSGRYLPNKVDYPGFHPWVPSSDHSKHNKTTETIKEGMPEVPL